jgi:hypothetical protein
VRANKKISKANLFIFGRILHKDSLHVFVAKTIDFYVSFRTYLCSLSSGLTGTEYEQKQKP